MDKTFLLVENPQPHQTFSFTYNRIWVAFGTSNPILRMIRVNSLIGYKFLINNMFFFGRYLQIERIVDWPLVVEYSNPCTLAS